MPALFFNDCLLKNAGIRLISRAAFDTDAAEATFETIYSLLKHQRQKILYEYSVSDDVAGVMAVLDQVPQDTATALADHITGAAQRTGRDAVAKFTLSMFQRRTIGNTVDSWSRKYGIERAEEMLGRPVIVKADSGMVHQRHHCKNRDAACSNGHIGRLGH